jgi:hypothetical protein
VITLILTQTASIQSSSVIFLDFVALKILVPEGSTIEGIYLHAPAPIEYNLFKELT